MEQLTEQRFHGLKTCMASTYGVSVRALEESFAVQPAVAQRLQNAITEKSLFLGKINTVPVSEMQGENVFAGIQVPVTGRTRVQDNHPRQPVSALSMSAAGYTLHPVESDVAVPFTVLDSWARFPDMYHRFQGYVAGRIAADRELTGWYGETAATETSRKKHPELQDVSAGWYQYMRTHKPENVLGEGASSGQIRFGTGGDYSCLDEVICDLVCGIPPFLRSDLVALIGDELIGYEKRRIFKLAGADPAEKLRMTASLSAFGGVSSWETPSHFPPRGLIITSYDNLSLYHQDSSWRRSVERENRYNRIAVYTSRNEGYVVEVPEKFVALEFKNVVLTDTEKDKE